MLKKLSIFLLLVGLKHVTCCAVPETYGLKCEPALSAPAHGSISCSNENFGGSLCTFTCEEGYKMVGHPSSQCFLWPNYKPSWTYTAPRCFRDYQPPVAHDTKLPGTPTLKCEPPFQAPVHGSVSCTNDNFLGSLCTFDCDEGYEMFGIGSTQCLSVKKSKPNWTNRNAPKCEPKHQPPIIQFNSGSYPEPPIIDDVSKPAVNIIYQLELTSEKGSFEECQIMCTQAGGTLAQHSLSSAYKDKMMKTAGYEPMWIGVNNKNIRNQWRYTSIGGGKKPFPIKDTASLVARWSKGQPIINNQLCATIYKNKKYGLEFSTLTCDPAESKKRYGICEHP